MDIDFGQILPDPTDAAYNSSTTYSAMQTCLDEYKSEWLSLVDGNRGHALPGYYADLAVLDTDIFTCDPMQIKDIKCDMTIVDGDVVFERK